MAKIVDELCCQECGKLFPDDGNINTCSSCGDVFCEECLSDQCACGDDGSGQYVTDLPDYMCEDCHEGYHEPPEPY